jgi:hypothetical protein
MTKELPCTVKYPVFLATLTELLAVFSGKVKKVARKKQDLTFLTRADTRNPFSQMAVRHPKTPSPSRGEGGGTRGGDWV